MTDRGRPLQAADRTNGRFGYAA